MAYLDTQLQLSDAQSITTSGNATNIIDFGQSSRRIADGESLVVTINIDTALAGTTPNIRFQWRQDNNATPTTVVATSQTYTSLAAGTTIFLPIAPIIAGRYGVLYFEVVSGTVSAFAMTAVLRSEDSLNSSPAVYASGFTVS